ncbi:MAG: sulfite exporter TauE/SafE family protein [Burkholderiales bacterium]|nr:sulfite exporter TauE/SafE family protein [Burkholderiales bacterium]
MPVDVTLATAFVVGLLGSSHCLGMCGGIAGTLALGVPRRGAALLPYLLAFNTGRIASYAAAGALAGLAGAGFFGTLPAPGARIAAQAISGGFMVALGLYLGGWRGPLGAVERAGARLWRRIEPLGRRLLPLRHPGQALLLGLLWGWLPCGMVYAALAWALAAGGAGAGAALMASFGAGTLPMMLATGGAAQALGRGVRSPWLRRGAGTLVLALGAVSLALAAAALAGHGAAHEGAHVHAASGVDPVAPRP